MLKFLSRKETTPAPDRLIPYGFSRVVKHFHDDIAWYEQERGRMEGRRFGRRDAVLERQSLLKRKALADRVTVFAPDSERETLNRHPSSIFRR